MLHPFLRHTKHIVRTTDGRVHHVYIPNDDPEWLHPHNLRAKATKKKITRKMRKTRRVMQRESRRANR